MCEKSKNRRGEENNIVKTKLIPSILYDNISNDKKKCKIILIY